MLKNLSRRMVLNQHMFIFAYTYCFKFCCIIYCCRFFIPFAVVCVIILASNFDALKMFKNIIQKRYEINLTANCFHRMYRLNVSFVECVCVLFVCLLVCFLHQRMISYYNIFILKCNK